MAAHATQDNRNDLQHSSFFLTADEKHLSDTQLMHTIMDNSQDTIYFKDRSSVFLLNSKAHAQQFGVDDPRELIGRSDLDFYPENFVRGALHDEKEIMKTGTPIVGRVERWEKDDGTVVWFLASKYPLYDDFGNIVGTWGTSRNITELKMAEQELVRVNAQLAAANSKLKELAIIDELSGLYNRRNFYEILQKTLKAYARRRAGGADTSFCLIILDIDCFKSVNDTYGHLAGDSVIRHVAGLLAENTRTSDYCFRYGGDEFALILPDSRQAGGRELAERLRLRIEKNPYIYNDITIPVTASLGVACFTGDEEAKDLVREADAMLYESKHGGKNRVS